MRWYKEIPFLIRHFGFRAMWNIAFRSRLDSNYSRDHAILSVMERGFENELALLLNTQTRTLNLLNSNDFIWVCWMQGEDKMPETIATCYKSLLRNKGSYNVQLISYSNYRKYVDLPDYIVTKHEAGVISNTHFSDVIRCYLLWKYGGIWIDAALFVTKVVDYNGITFSSPKMAFDSSNSINLKWTVGCLAAGKNFLLFEFAYKYLFAYWRKYDTPIVYLLLDHVFELAYLNNDTVKMVIDGVPLNNEGLHWCRYHFNDKCDTRVYNELIENNQFLSLTWRLPYRLQDENGELTYYGRLLKDFDRPQ